MTIHKPLLRNLLGGLLIVGINTLCAVAASPYVGGFYFEVAGALSVLSVLGAIRIWTLEKGKTLGGSTWALIGLFAGMIGLLLLYLDVALGFLVLESGLTRLSISNPMAVIFSLSFCPCLFSVALATAVRETIASA